MHPNSTQMIRVLLIAVFLLVSSFSLAQTGLPGLNNIPKVEQLPPTPQAASLGKYGQIPISHQSGIPNITIPMHELRVNDFEYPISLSYHAGGVKVDEVATNVGLGWSLNAGGSISTTLKSNQNLDSPDSTWLPPNSVGATPCVYLDNAPAEYLTTKLWVENPLLYNFEPQVYNFSFGSYSGRFILKSNPDLANLGTLLVNQQAVLLPQQPMKIYLVTDPADQTQFYVAINETGVKYFFRQTERTSMNTSCVPGSMNVQYPTENLSYVISSIETPNGHIFSFTNRNEVYTYVASKSQTATKSAGNLPGCSSDVSGTECINTMTVNTRLVESIVSSDGQRVEFIYSIDRLDLPGSKRLDSVRVFYDININSTIPDKEFVLTYAYVSSRLMLQSVYANSGGKQLPPHVFQYESGMPVRLNNDQDHFGYYNAAGNGQKFIPLQPGIPEFGVIYYGANREVNPDYAKAGILNKITYPTGGWTEFAYESKVGGGLQIKRIKDYDDGGKLANERGFTYSGGTGISVGSYLTSYSAIQILNPSDLGCPIGNCDYYQITSYPQTQSPVSENTGNTWTEEIIGNSTIGYGGKTRYEFMTNQDFQLEAGFNHVSNSGYLTDWSFITNLLQKEIQYRYEPAGNPQWIAVKSKQFKYEIPRTKQVAFKAVKIEQTESEQRVEYSIWCYQCVTAKFQALRYQFVTAWPRVIEEIDTEFDSNGNPALVRNTYSKDFDIYSFKARQIEFLGSNGMKQIVHRKFPSSYPGYSSYQEMVKRNINLLIEEVVVDNAGRILSGSINDFQLMNNQFRLINYFSYESGAVNNYSGGAPLLSNPQNPPSTTFTKRLTIESYDVRGNPVQFVRPDGKRIAYLRSNNGRYIHAAVENAQFSQCYYNSFETTGTLATIEPAKTGNKYYEGDFSLNLSGIQSGSSLTFWYWDAGKWNFKSIPYNGGGIILTDGSRIDEVRVTPPSAIMQTFAYSPKGEVISTADSNGNPIYFNYDGFGRLVKSMDLNYNILSTNLYKYLNEN